MSRLSRDLGIACAITAGILLSLILARLLTADPAPVTDPTTTSTTSTAAASAAGDGALPGTPTAPATTPGTTTTPSIVEPAPAAAASMVLSSGAQVVPRPGQPPQSYRPAPTDLPAPPTQSPADTPDPAVYADPAAVATVWLAAMCWYDYRTGPEENTARAAAYGDTGMPDAANPWAMDEQAWAQVTAGHLGSGCTNITATPAHTGHDGADQDTVTLTATQVLSVDGTPYQAIPISLTRTLKHDPDGRWLIGPVVTAN